MSARAPARTRDPERRGRILAAATGLVAERGFHSVSMAQIGSAAGIVGSGVYRHFQSKSAVVVAILDEAMDRLQLDAEAAATTPGSDALDRLIEGQIRFAADDRRVLQLYQREVHTLPDGDRHRLRRRQRRYVEEWVRVLAGLRPQLPEREARVLAHAAIGAIQSVASYDEALPHHELTARLAGIARAVLTA